MSYDPFSIIEIPKVGFFSGLTSRAGTVLVVDRAGHELRALDGAADRLTAGEARWGQIRTLYAVDVREHQLQFEDTLPCSDDAGGFRAVVNVTCKVRKQAATDIVRRGIHDASALLVPLITETLRRTCGKFAAELSADAEQAGLDAVRSIEERGGHDPVFEISGIHLMLTLDAAAANYVAQIKKLRRDGKLQEDTAKLAAEKARLEAELASATREFDHERLEQDKTRARLEGELAAQEEELEVARAIARDLATDRGAQNLQRQRLQFEQERLKIQANLDMQQLKIDLERAELEAQLQQRRQTARLALEAENLNQLRGLLEQGEFGQLALQLMRDPNSISSVIDQLASQRNANATRQLHALRLMLENDGLEGWKITEQAKQVLQNLLATWSTETPPLGLADAGNSQLPPPAENRASVVEVQDATIVVSPQGEGDYLGDREPVSGPAVVPTDEPG